MPDGNEYGRRDLSEVLPLRVNEEAVVFRGCTTSEITLIVVASTIFWVVVTGFVGAMVGEFYLFLGFSLFLVLVTAFIASTIFQRIKRGQAPGHYQHVVSLLLASIGMKRTPFVRTDGQLRIGRTEQLVLVRRHLGVDVDATVD